MVKAYYILFLLLFLTLQGYSQKRTLDDYISTGLKNSPLLKNYENQLQSGSLDSLLALSAFKPQVDFTSQILVAPAGNHFGYDEAISNGGNYAAVIGVKQSLFNDKIRSAQLKNINLLKQSLATDRLITQTDLKKSITLQYITAYSDFELSEFELKMIELLTEQQKAVRYLVEAGIYQQTDLMNLAVNQTSHEITYKQEFIQYKNDVALLNLLSGIVDTATVQLEKPEISLVNHYEIQQSPVMLQFTIDSLKNSHAKNLIDLNYRPKLEAFAEAGFMAVKPLNIPNNFGTNFGLNFTVPLYDGKRRGLEYKKIEITEKSRMLNRNFYTSQYRQQYLQLIQQIRLTDALIEDIKLQVQQQKDLIDVYKTEMEKGIVKFTDFLITVNSYSSTRNNLSVAEMNRLQLINQLNYLK